MSIVIRLRLLTNSYIEHLFPPFLSYHYYSLLFTITFLKLGTNNRLVVLVSIVSPQVQASSNNKNSSNFVAIPSQNYNNRIINPLLVKEIKKKNHAILILSSRTRVSHLYTKSGGIVSGRRGEGGWGWKGNGRVYVFFVTCDSKNALECLSSGVKYLCSDRLYFVFDRRRGSRLPAILTVYRYTEKYIYIYKLAPWLYRYYNGKTVESYRSRYGSPVTIVWHAGK